MMKNVYWSSCKEAFILVSFSLIKIEFSPQIFQKSSCIKFNENPPSGSRVIEWGRKDGRTDRHGGANNRFSQFFEGD
jgi:hypothetical protein